MQKKHLPFIYFLLVAHICFSQSILQGRVVDKDKNPIQGASVEISGIYKGTVSGIDGTFSLQVASAKTYEIICKHIGYSSAKIIKYESDNNPIIIVLRDDPLALSEVQVTGIMSNISGMQNAQGITILKSDYLRQNTGLGIGHLLSNIPGIFIDNTSGDGGNTVYTRGLNPNPGNVFANVGYKYLSLQEDGMPVMSSQMGFLWTDMFVRHDLSVKQVEANRSGSSSTTATNTPGGIINFISKTGEEKTKGQLEIAAGIHGNGKIYSKTDFNIGGMFSEIPIIYNLSGMYRFDEGYRNLPYNAANGGQFKANFSFNTQYSTWQLYLKALDDYTSYYQRVPFLDVEKSIPYPGFDPLYSSLYVAIKGEIPNSHFINEQPTAKRNVDGAQRIHAQNYYAMLRSTFEINKEIALKFSAKYSLIRQDYVQSFSNMLIPIDKGPALLYNLPITSGAIRFNSFSYTDAKSGELLASFVNGEQKINKIGNFLHIGSLLDLKTNLNDKIFKAELNYQKDNLIFALGSEWSSMQFTNLWNADLTAETFEPVSRPLVITHPNALSYIFPNQEKTMYFTDNNGIFGYNYGSYNYFEGKTLNGSGFFNGRLSITKKIVFNAGYRFDRIQHQGKKERWATPSEKDKLVNTFNVGLDNDYTTWYDVAFRKALGVYDTFRYFYNCHSFVAGALLKKDDYNSFFANVTISNKAPEMDYYVNNFENMKPEKGYVETVKQFEVGYKTIKSSYSGQFVLFFNRLENVPFQQFIYLNNNTVITPVTFNTMQSIGIETENNLYLLKNFQVQLNATLMNPRLHKFIYHNINFTPTNPNDDVLEDFSGNLINEVPRINAQLKVYYAFRGIRPYLSIHYVGDRMGNMRNTIKLPAYFTTHSGINIKFHKNLDIFMNASNIFNTVGIVSLGGLASLNNGGTEMLTKEKIQQEKENQMPIFARTIQPRMLTVSFKYYFE